MSGNRRSKKSEGSQARSEPRSRRDTSVVSRGQNIRRSEGRGSTRVPLFRLKNIAGFFLLPVAWVWTAAFFGLFKREASRSTFWLSEEVWFFGMGVAAWLLWFSWSLSRRGEPHGMRLYVMGHELTHAAWALLCGGTVEEIRWGREGGHVITNKPNVWVTLAPYFYPIYSVALVIVFAVALLFYQYYPDWSRWVVTPLQLWFAALGASWAFHFSFTVWMIHLGQSDLRMHGNFFSIVLIYIMNVVVLSLHLVLVVPGGGFLLFGGELLRHAEDFSEVVWQFGLECVRRM